METLAAAPRYREPVKALTCYKGVKNLFALTMITEIGDVKRFAHPRQLVSWFGMDIREYASGGKSLSMITSMEPFRDRFIGATLGSV